MTRAGEREIGAVSRRLTDNPRELAGIIIIFSPQYMSNQYETVMLFLKPDIYKKERILLFTVCFVRLVTHSQ